MSTKLTTRWLSTAQVQEAIRNKATPLAIPAFVWSRMQAVRSRDSDDARSLDQFDIQRCLSSCVVRDFLYADEAIFATVIGLDSEGENLILMIRIPDDDNMPLFVDDFVVVLH
jgi:anaerobic glycerol-3-phosphate dehydrogenase